MAPSHIHWQETSASRLIHGMAWYPHGVAAFPEQMIQECEQESSHNIYYVKAQKSEFMFNIFYLLKASFWVQ
jgi:hypothetical protein